MKTIRLRATLTCPNCMQPLHVQGLTEQELCRSCSASVELPPDFWVGTFGGEEIADALSAPAGEMHQMTVMGGQQRIVAYGNGLPACSCGIAFPPEAFEAAATSGSHSCTCGARISVRPAGDLARALHPDAEWVVGEGAIGSDNAEPEQSVEPVLFACMACGGTLKVDGSSRSITCEFCSGSNYLPDGLWLRLHPPQTVRDFGIVLGASGGKASPAFLARLAASSDDRVRASAASNPDAPAEILERLGRDEDYEVRAAVAGNPSTPQDTLAHLADDDDLDVLQALAKNPSLSLPTLCELAEHEDEDVRARAARNPELPAEVLIRLAQQEDLVVRRSLAKRADLPEPALLVLAEEEDKKVVKRLMANAGSFSLPVLQALHRTHERHRDTLESQPAWAVASSGFPWKLIVGCGLLVLLGGAGLLAVPIAWLALNAA